MAYDPAASGRLRAMGEEVSAKILVEATKEEQPFVFAVALAAGVFQNILVSVLYNKFRPGDPAAELHARKIFHGVEVDVCSRWRSVSDEKPVQIIYLDGTAEVLDGTNQPTSPA